MAKPTIRFRGFDDEWEQRKLGNIFKEYSEKNHTELPALTIIQGGGTVKREDSDRNLMYDESNLSNYKMVQKDDFIVHLRSFEGGLEKSSLDGIISPAYHTFHSDVADSRFYYPYFRSHEFIKYKLVPHVYGIRDGRSIDVAGMKTIEIPYTSMEEQRKIGDYLDSLDHLITLHQRKCDETKKLKKYMLQKMFPQNGSKVPEIRFKGFTDEWEQRKLGDVIEKLTGGASIAPDDYVDVGYRTIPKGAVNSSGVADMSGCKNVSEDFFEKNISSKTSSGELVTSLRDLVPTAPNMGRIVRICGETEDFLMPQGVYSIIVKEKNSEDFLITYSNSPEYRKIIMAEKNGSTQVHIRNGEFLNIDIPLPSYEEQMKIGEHFKTLDHVIALHQHKCEELKKLKKFMLQNMFTQKNK